MRPQGELSLTLPLWLFDFIARKSLGKNKYLETKQRSTASWPHPGQHPLLNTQATFLTPHSLSPLFTRCDFLFLFLSAWENLWPFVWSVVSVWAPPRTFFMQNCFSLSIFHVMPSSTTPPPAPFSLSLSHSFSALVSILDLFVWVAKCRNLRTLAR